jgi:lipid II:glycine glycyltransferase (peptidoglycan interpeptide bridge formation enzyme)
MLLTRRRHQLPPQPIAWFRNLIECLGQQLTIHVASKDSAPVASIMTLAYKNSLVYKYGCSDSRFNNLGGTSFLFWQAIGEGKRAGMEEFDLGRSGLEDPGLSSFKGHLGATESELNYYRYSTSPLKNSSARRERPYLRSVFACMPDAIFTGVGRLLYRHMG